MSVGCVSKHLRNYLLLTTTRKLGCSFCPNVDIRSQLGKFGADGSVFSLVTRSLQVTLAPAIYLPYPTSLYAEGGDRTRIASYRWPAIKPDG